MSVPGVQSLQGSSPQQNTKEKRPLGNFSQARVKQLPVLQHCGISKATGGWGTLAPPRGSSLKQAPEMNEIGIPWLQYPVVRFGWLSYQKPKDTAENKEPACTRGISPSPCVGVLGSILLRSNLFSKCATKCKDFPK